MHLPVSPSSPDPEPPHRQSRALSLLALHCACFLFAACDEPKPPDPPLPTPSPLPATTSEAQLLEWLAQTSPSSVISEQTRSELARHAASSRRWPHKPWARQRLALFGHRLAYLDAGGMKVRALAPPRTPGLSAAESILVPLDEFSRVVALFDGGALLFDSRHTFYLPIDKPSLQRLPHLPLLGDVQILADPRHPSAFSLLHPTLGTVGAYRVDQASKSGILLPLSEAHLGAKNTAACSTLRDGSLMCVGPSGVFAGYPGLPMRPRGQLPASHNVFRVCAGTTQTEYLVIDRAGRIRTFSLEDPARVLAERALGVSPLELVEAGGRLAYLNVPGTESSPTTLRLTVTESKGKELFVTELSLGSPTPFGDLDVDLALHAHRPWVGVRTQSTVTVFDHALAKLLFTAQITPSG